jgi:hypothetical protein
MILILIKLPRDPLGGGKWAKKNLTEDNFFVKPIMESELHHFSDCLVVALFPNILQKNL